MQKSIIVKGAREHNLKDVSLMIPRDSLVGISGPSGSGKSSLAFDTIFAEGQRRYVESLSSYARQFLGKTHKPQVDSIEGLSPAISIEQKTTHNNPRSTVGTITEIYDYYRLLYARIGELYCPNGHGKIQSQSIDQIADAVLELTSGAKIMILAPLVSARKGEHHKILEDAKKAGFTRIRINGKLVSLEQDIVLNKSQKHSLELVIDRLILGSSKERLYQSLETALSAGAGKVLVAVLKEEGSEEEYLFSQKNSCPECAYSFPEIEPRLFSFNSPYGACKTCSGLGMMLEFDQNRIVPDPTLKVKEAIVPYKNSRYHQMLLAALAIELGFSLNTPYQDLDAKTQKILAQGYKKKKLVIFTRPGSKHSSYKSYWKGFFPELKRRYQESSGEDHSAFEHYMSKELCRDCGGKRLNEAALAVTLKGESIYDVNTRTVQESLFFFKNWELSENRQIIALSIIKEISSRLRFLQSVGLSYLSLDRQAQTLSGGESQRIRLASQIGSALTGVLYVLDEPTIGLHQRDNQRLIDTLKHLRDLGNTVLVVEHDQQLLLEADHLIDIGPGAGIHGGHVIAQGVKEAFLKNKKSLTAPYLTHQKMIELPAQWRPFDLKKGPVLKVVGAYQNNLKDINVSFPVACLNIITGVSGSGKSTLLNDIIHPYMANRLNRLSHLKEGQVKAVSGQEHFDKIIAIDQNPIGRTPHSNPATYVEVFTPIRDLFASLHESRVRGYSSGRFSFNVKGGRCESCRGYGVSKIEMHFLPDVYVVCDVCEGRRFNKETLEILYKGKNIYDVLQMSVEESAAFFLDISRIHNRLGVLESVGLGYIKLGQSSLTLSGGEAQRTKLAYQLSKRNTGKTLYIIDEPTTGLHFVDIEALLKVVHRLVDLGNTVLMIEHNLDVIKQADYIVDLGPDGGPDGGEIVASGTPKELAKAKTFTGFYLKQTLLAHQTRKPVVERKQKKSIGSAPKK